MNFPTYEQRTITTGDGATHVQHRFLCPVHGWFDLFAHPNAPMLHAGCGEVFPGGEATTPAQSPEAK